MKRLLAIPLLLAAVGCQTLSKYPSKYEAKDACKDWDNTLPERRCEVEQVTNQVLGIEWLDGKDTVVKRFRY
jgi:hypothetical protein